VTSDPTDNNTHSSPAKTLVVHPAVDNRTEAGGRSLDGRVEEAVGLAQAISLDVCHAEAIRVKAPRPATLFGLGHVERLAELIEEQGIELVIVDGALTPVQQRNLERDWKAKVIDRTALILEIFGARARTYEGRLQVELAALTYQRSRLVRSWTHLERQRGGFGFLGGPGESQLEIDRRLIGDRIAKLRRELDEVKRTRELHRDARRRVPYPVVSLVGYTNAGKSTLFNRLTRASVMAEDLLFATLDPTMRGLTLPSGRRIILSDTVGFISDLPTQLVAAFRATLEEVREAEILLHVRDVSHPDSDAQKADVEAVLKDLKLARSLDGRLVEVWNKIDRLPEEAREAWDNRAQTAGAAGVAISAVTGAGIDALLARLDLLLGRQAVDVSITLDIADGRAMAWLYQHGDVVERQDDDAECRMQVRLDPANLARFRQGFPQIVAQTDFVPTVEGEK